MPAWWEQLQAQRTPSTPEIPYRHVQRAVRQRVKPLGIARVNGREAPQRCLSIPKTAYPYHCDGSWLPNRADNTRSIRSSRCTREQVASTRSFAGMTAYEAA